MGGSYGTNPFRQRIPRPPSATPGRSPSWASLSGEMRGSVALDRFTGAGSEGPAHDPVDAHDDSVSFAVLVPLFAVDGEATVLLIRRAARLRRDAGHVAFPGGRVEPGERPLEAALREATEEIGLDPAQVTVVRRLQVVERPDGDRIAAFLGVLAERPVLTLNWEEVEAVIELPLAALLADGVGWQERWSLGGDERRIHFFADPSTLGEDLIWGLTAGILWSLLEGAIPATEVPASPDPTE